MSASIYGQKGGGIMIADAQAKLKARGILDAATEAGWTYSEWRGMPGWIIPLYQGNGKRWHLPDGRPAQRWKNFDSSAKPKALWGYPDQGGDDVKKPDGCDYYWIPGAIAAIAASGGAVHLTAGEPDLLTLVSAGIRNATSFFGEQNIPDNLVSVFRQIGVKRVVYYPDNDETGWDAAQTLYDLLQPTGIEFTAKQLIEQVKDLNELWQGYLNDRDLFLAILRDSKTLKLANLHDAPSTDLRGTGLRDFPSAFYDAIEAALGASYKRNGGWSSPLPCVFASHEHDDKTPSAHWHKDKHIYRCFKCGTTALAKDVAERLNLDFRDYLPSRPLTAAATPPLPPTPPAYHTSDDALQRFIERLDGLHVQDYAPLVFPFYTLHDLGGFCRMVQPRKLIGIIGLSGGGKTSFLETMTDAWRKIGVHILWWGPEWSWDQMADRAVQRYGGLSITQMMLHEVWMSEQQNQNGEETFGERADDDLVEKSRIVARDVAAWKGKAVYLDRMDITLDTLLDDSERMLEDQRKQGRVIRVAVWDYVQLMQLKGVRGDAERVNLVVTRIKAFCVDHGLVGIIASQPRKQDSSSAQEDEEPQLLDSQSAQYMREDQFNLMLTLNPVKRDGRVSDEAVINVVKNSAGRKDKRTVKIDLAHLRWVDRR